MSNRLEPLDPRLQVELLRLFPVPSDDAPAHAPVRFLVIGVAAPADWPALSAVWRGVQADLAWPAPAIAVNGADAFELWLPLQSPAPVSEARRMLQTLCSRYLADVLPSRWRLWPALDAGPSVAPTSVPKQHEITGRWSAFVAPDLAAVFGDDPSLDLPPGGDAQAEVLSHIRLIAPDDWRQGLAVLGVNTQPPAVSSPKSLGAASVPGAVLPQTGASALSSVGADPYDGARHFLLQVMNDPSVDLTLRVEAAKALLQNSQS